MPVHLEHIKAMWAHLQHRHANFAVQENTRAIKASPLNQCACFALQDLIKVGMECRDKTTARFVIWENSNRALEPPYVTIARLVNTNQWLGLAMRQIAYHVPQVPFSVLVSFI